LLAARRDARDVVVAFLGRFTGLVERFSLPGAKDVDGRVVFLYGASIASSH
jgi:hypothetical protein